MLQQISNRSGPAADAPVQANDQPLVSAAMPAPESAVLGKAVAGFAGTFEQLAALPEENLPEQSSEQAEATDSVEVVVHEKTAPAEPLEQKRALLAILEATEQLLRGASAPATEAPEQVVLTDKNVLTDKSGLTDKGGLTDKAVPAEIGNARLVRKNMERTDANLSRAQTVPSAEAPVAATLMDAKPKSAQAQVGPGLINSQMSFEVEQSKISTNAGALATPATPSGSPTAPLSPAVAQPLVLEQAVKLQGPEAKWGEQMLHSLRENVELQVQQRMQSATIRLDPPELGSMEILLKHEGGHLSVQISASQVDVAKLLQQLSEKLRHELVGQNFTQVSVSVSSDGAPDRQPSQQRGKPFLGEDPIMAEQLFDAPNEEKRPRLSDVLVTV